MSVKNQIYDEKKKKELEFYSLNKKKKKKFFSNLFHLRIFFNSKTSSYNYISAMRQMKRFVSQKLTGKKLENILIAPCGGGSDYRYLAEFSKNVYGIDLSPIQIKSCPKQMNSKVGDILESGYNNEQFDMIASLGFFHHYVKNFGFDAFLREFHRILKSDGKLIIMEPSIFHPLFAFTRPIKKIFNNPFKEVEDETPFRPKLMINALKRNGFTNVEFRAASFSHVWFYIPIAKFVNLITATLLNKWPFKLFGWMVLFWGEKN